MEREQWTRVVEAVRAASIGHRERDRKFSDAIIVLTMLWAVLHDRPILWATDPRNWPFHMRVKSRPTASTMSRRLRSLGVIALKEKVHRILTPVPEGSSALIIDAKPLPVGGYTNDRDARSGRACGCFAWGYKLYLVIDENGGVHAWKVDSMNVAEQRVAEELIPAATLSAGAGRWLLGDKAYDSNRLYELADKHGLWLLAPRYKPGTAIGKVQSRGRRYAINLLESGAASGLARMKRRDAVERFLGTLCSSGGGLSPLPGYVRNLHRVRLWVGAKLLLNAARTQLRQAAAA